MTKIKPNPGVPVLYRLLYGGDDNTLIMREVQVTKTPENRLDGWYDLQDVRTFHAYPVKTLDGWSETRKDAVIEFLLRTGARKNWGNTPIAKNARAAIRRFLDFGRKSTAFDERGLKPDED